MSEVDDKPQFREFCPGQLRHTTPMLPLDDSRLVSSLTVRELRLLLHDVVPLTKSQKLDIQWHADVKALRAELARMKRANNPRWRKPGTPSPVPPFLLADSTRRLKEVDHALELQRIRSLASVPASSARPRWAQAIARLRARWRKLGRMTRPLPDGSR